MHPKMKYEPTLVNLSPLESLLAGDGSNFTLK